MNQPVSSGIAELQAENLNYEINDKLILKELSLVVKSGEVLFIEGGNGSGKTTLLRVLCGLIQADEGDIRWNGESIRSAAIDYYQQLIYIGHETGVKPELTAIENLRFFSSISGVSTDSDLQAAIDWVGLSGYENSPGRHLSYGQKRRIAIARLVTERSLLWILDEPFAGLDKLMVEKLQTRFLEHTSEGGILLLTSHQSIALDKMKSVHVELKS